MRKNEARAMVRHVSGRLNDMREELVENMVDDVGVAEWAAETEYYTAKVVFKRK